MTRRFGIVAFNRSLRRFARAGVGPSLSIDHSFGRSGATRKGRERCIWIHGAVVPAPDRRNERAAGDRRNSLRRGKHLPDLPVTTCQQRGRKLYVNIVVDWSVVAAVFDGDDKG
jgi:hypothetical protein